MGVRNVGLIISAIPIESTIPATIPKWSIFFNSISLVLIQSGLKSPGVAPLGETRQFFHLGKPQDQTGCPRPHSSSLQNVIASWFNVGYVAAHSLGWLAKSLLSDQERHIRFLRLRVKVKL